MTTNTDKETIEFAAIKFCRWGDSFPIIMTSMRHHEILWLMNEMGIKYRKDDASYVQGFWTNRDRFVTREEAMEIAIKSGQIKPSSRNYLISEDLW